MIEELIEKLEKRVNVTNKALDELNTIFSFLEVELQDRNIEVDTDDLYIGPIGYYGHWWVKIYGCTIPASVKGIGQNGYYKGDFGVYYQNLCYNDLKYVINNISVIINKIINEIEKNDIDFEKVNKLVEIFKLIRE